jgi:phosphatidate phosphatase APP1
MQKVVASGTANFTMQDCRKMVYYELEQGLLNPPEDQPKRQFIQPDRRRSRIIKTKQEPKKSDQQSKDGGIYEKFVRVALKQKIINAISQRHKTKRTVVSKT